MRPRKFSDRADPAALEDEAELVPNNLVTDSTMEAEPFTAAHEVTRIGSKGYTRVRPAGWKEHDIGSLYQGDVGSKRANQQP